MKKLVLALALAGMASGAFAATVYTGNKVQGVPVITKLDVSDLAAGKTHRFMFKGAEKGISQHYYIPVVVVKGAKEGAKLGVQAGVHGNELNGIRVAQRLIQETDPTKLAGTLIVVPLANPNGVVNNSRGFQFSNGNRNTVDYNRIWPGKEKGNAAERQAFNTYNHLWGKNVDLFVDLHTSGEGTAFPLFIYADTRDAKVKEMAELIPVDQMKQDAGEKGTVETTFVANKIPALTLELGSPKVFEKDFIDRSVVGINNIMIKNGMLTGKMGKTQKEQKTFVGNDYSTLRTDKAGFAEMLVKIGDDVKAGQKIATLRSPFGDVVQDVLAKVDGRVVYTITDPMVEPNGVVGRLLLNNTDPKCADLTCWN